MPVVDGKPVEVCRKCDGLGRTDTECPVCVGVGEMYINGWAELCEECRGDGRELCTNCDGKGIEYIDDYEGDTHYYEPEK